MRATKLILDCVELFLELLLMLLVLVSHDVQAMTHVPRTDINGS